MLLKLLEFLTAESSSTRDLSSSAGATSPSQPIRKTPQPAAVAAVAKRDHAAFWRPAATNGARTSTTFKAPTTVSNASLLTPSPTEYVLLLTLLIHGLNISRSRQRFESAEKEARSFARFKRKIEKLDPGASIDPNNRLSVRCSGCLKVSIQRDFENTERFKEHRNSKKCLAKASTPQTFLTSFMSQSTPTAAPPSGPPTSAASATPSQLPAGQRKLGFSSATCACPGICEAQDPRVAIYLSRTQMETGGAPPRAKLLQKSMVNHPDFTEVQHEREVVAQEQRQALWINHHMSKSVRSSTCTQVSILKPNGAAIPCDSCLKLLRVKTFVNALTRPVPEQGNAKFTPFAARNELVGHAYARHTDVEGLFVRRSATLVSHSTDIFLRKPRTLLSCGGH
jgi:hypothetical protein